MADGRPYADFESLRNAASASLSDLTDDDWLAAAKAHPRIGESGGDAPHVSAREQSQAMRGAAQTLTALAAENRQYEDRFGHVFLIRASGRSAEEILAELRRRIANDPVTEVRTEIKRELGEIAMLRLERLVSE